MMNTGELVSLSDWARANGIAKNDVGRYRRHARSGEWDDAVYVAFAKRWAVKTGSPVPSLPPRGTRFVTQRTDGRRRFVVYMNDDERINITDIVGIPNVIDPRVLSRKRRARKRAMANAIDDNVGGKPIETDANGAP